MQPDFDIEPSYRIWGVLTRFTNFYLNSVSDTGRTGRYALLRVTQNKNLL